MRFLYYGWIPEWPKGADCKSVGDAFEGSNPSPSIQESRGKNQNGSNPSPSIQESRGKNQSGSNPSPSIQESRGKNQSGSNPFRIMKQIANIFMPQWRNWQTRRT